MTEDVFTDLVNLYLDQEISEEDLQRLRAELAANPERKKRFLERRCLHNATCLALKPRAGQGPEDRRQDLPRPQSALGERFRGYRSNRRQVKRPAKARMAHPDSGQLPRWVLGTGVAASLLIASVLFTPVVRDSLSGLWGSGLVRFQAPERLIEDDLPAEVHTSDLERYRKVQAKANQPRSSLVAQMRLLGLRPELTPVDKKMRSVDAPSLERGQNGISRAEHLTKLQKMKPIPEPKLLRSEVIQPEPRSNWGRGGFDVHLVGY